MTPEEALRFLMDTAKMKELLSIPKIAENNAKIREACKVLAKALKRRAKEMDDDKGTSD